MKKSISYWAFVGGLDGTKDISECLTEAKELGFEAVELCIGETGALSLDATESDCEKIKAHAEEIRIELSSVASGIYWDYSFGASAAEDREKTAKAIDRMLHIGRWLCVDALLTIPASVDVFFNPEAEIIPYDVAYERAKEGITKLVPVAEECGVAIAIENVWNKFLLSPLEMRDFIDSFNSEFVGAYFDVGNVLATGYPEQWIRILGSRIKKVHLKDYRIAVGDVNGFVDLLEGDVNWPEVMKALDEIGYDGYVTAEMIPPYAHSPEVRLKNTSNAMDAILGRT